MTAETSRVSTSRGAVLVVGSQGVSFVTQIGSLVVLSHLLPVRAFGIVAMVSAVVGLAGVLGSFGLSLSALAGRTPSHAERSNLFWLNTAFGLAAVVIITACAPLVADIYHVPQLRALTSVLALPFLLGAIAVQFNVEMNLAGQWTRLALVQVVPGLIALVVAAIIAAMTHSYWALAIQTVLAAGLGLALAVYLCDWRPSLPSRGTDVWYHLRFGRDTVAIQLITYGASNVDSVFLGRALGSTVLGQYNRAYNIAAMPTSRLAVPLEQVVVPRLTRSLNVDFEAVLMRCQTVLIYALTAPLSLVAGTAFPLVRVILGSRWTHVPELIQIQACGQVFSGIGYAYYWSFLVKRRTHLLLCGEGVVEVAMMAAVVILASHGAVTVAWCVAGGSAGMTLASALIARVSLKLPIFALAKVWMPPFVMFVVAAVLAQIVQSRIATAIPGLLVSGLVWMSVCIVACALTPRIRADLRLMRQFISSARSGA